MLQQVKNYVIKIKHDLNTPLPIQDNTIDIVICLFVLLHIDNIKLLFSEIYRIVKKGGFFVGSVPFIYQIHAAPNDYFRF